MYIRNKNLGGGGGGISYTLQVSPVSPLITPFWKIDYKIILPLKTVNGN